MTKALASARNVRGLDSVDGAVWKFEDEWRHGERNLETHLGLLEAEATVPIFSALAKVDLRLRFMHGESPTVAEYLERYPGVRAHGERVVSLVYEEYCLLQERGELLDAGVFCQRYPEWKDSLVAQLRYHVLLSRAAEAAVSPPPRLPEPGERFEQFDIRRELGRGGAGRVYLASEEPLGGREVALKVGLDRGHEPKILGRLAHAHIVPVHSAATQLETKLRWICMPYQPGLPLDLVIKRINESRRPRSARGLWSALEQSDDAPVDRAPILVGGPGWESFPVRGSYADAVAWVVATLAEALAHAHSRDVVHRDVKPSNVLLTYRDGPQLLDFNLAHDPHSVVEAEAALRGGTLPYMAPEQLEAFINPTRWDRVGAAADLYSLGLLLREMLTGEGPELPRATLPLPRAIQDLHDRRAAGQPRLRSDQKIPHALEAIGAKCLEFSPSQRYTHATELAEDLRRHLARKPLRHVHNPSRAERAKNWIRRRRLPLAVAAMVTLIVLAAGTNRWLHQREARRAFVAAVAALDGGRPKEALAVLEAAAKEEPDSPVIQFHYHAALEEAGKGSGADARFDKVLLRPGAKDVLIAWGRIHPSLTVHAGKIVVKVMERAPLKDPDRSAAELDHARRLYELILALDPGSEMVTEGLAVIAERRNDFAGAREVLDRLGDGVGEPKSPEDQKRLMRYHQLSARISIRSVQATLARPEAPTSTEAAVREITRALQDLDRVKSLASADDTGIHFDVDYKRCEASLAFGDLLIRQHKPNEARTQFALAGKLLQTLTTPMLEGQTWFKELSARVGQRLEPAREEANAAAEGAGSL